MIHILLVDDHPAYRLGVKELLNNFPKRVEVDEAENANVALNCILKKQYQVVFLDISMPGRSGLEFLKDLKLNSPKTKVIINSFHSEERYALRAIQEGASGYLTKNCRIEDYYEVLQSVLDGKNLF